MAAPINNSNSVSPLRTAASRSENPASKTVHPGELPFTRSAAQTPAAEKSGADTVNVDVEGFPTHLLFKQSNGEVTKIRRASQMAPAGPAANPAPADVVPSLPGPNGDGISGR